MSPFETKLHFLFKTKFKTPDKILAVKVEINILTHD